MASKHLLQTSFFTFAIFCYYISTSVQPVNSQGLLESIRNGIQNVIRPRQERNSQPKVETNATKSNPEAASTSNSMQNQIKNPVHYPIFVPSSSLGSSSWMPASSPLSSGSILGEDFSTASSSSSQWPGSSSEAPFGMEVYEEDQLLAHKENLLKRQRNGETATSANAHPHPHHPSYHPHEYSPSEESSSRQPDLPDSTHHLHRQRVTDESRPHSITYNSAGSFLGSPSTSTSYIDHSPLASSSSSSSSSLPPSPLLSPLSPPRPRDLSPLAGNSMIRQFYHNPVIEGLASSPLQVWTKPSFLTPVETTTLASSSSSASSYFPSLADFTTAEALASAKLLK